MRPTSRWRIRGPRIASVAMVGAGVYLVTDLLLDRNAGGFSLLFALAWALMSLAFVAVAWIGPVRQRRFVRRAVATPGRVVTKSMHSRNRRSSTRYEIAYAFVVTDGRAATGVTVVSPRVFESLAEGDAVTVLYPPGKPDRSVLYESCDFKAAG